MAKSEKPAQAGGAAQRQVFKVVIDAPVETVWNTLVKTDAVLPFFFGAVCDAGPGLGAGRPMRMVSADRKFAIVVGEVLEFSPPHRYAHTMAFTQYEGEAPARVSYDLKELPGGRTEFVLTTDAIPTTKTGKSMVQGGAFITQNLKSLVETGKPAFSGSMVLMLNPLMGAMTPKICRIENWPLVARSGK